MGRRTRARERSWWQWGATVLIWTTFYACGGTNKATTPRDAGSDALAGAGGQGGTSGAGGAGAAGGLGGGDASAGSAGVGGASGQGGVDSGAGAGGVAGSSAEGGADSGTGAGGGAGSSGQGGIGGTSGQGGVDAGGGTGGSVGSGGQGGADSGAGTGGVAGSSGQGGADSGTGTGGQGGFDAGAGAGGFDASAGSGGTDASAGGTSGASGAAGTAGRGGSGGTGGTASSYPGDVSGTRLKAKFWAGSDGAKHYSHAALYDSQLAVDCAYATASDGQLRCLPIVSPSAMQGVIYYSDGSCTQPMSFVSTNPPVGCSPYVPKYVYSGQQSCPHGEQRFHIYPVQSIITNPTPHKLTNGTCSNANVSYPSMIPVALGTELSASSFVAGTRTHLP